MAALRDTLRLSATMGVEQNSPILTPGVAKRASWLATARSQLATSWQPGGRGDAVHRGDHRLRRAHDGQHHVGAGGHGLGEEGAAAVGIVAMRRQFLEIVTGGEGRAGAGDDDGANGIRAADLANGAGQRRDQLLGEGVARLGPVQREQRDRTAILAQQHCRVASPAVVAIFAILFGASSFDG